MTAEVNRVAVLRRYAILDTPEEQSFDDLAKLAASVSQFPIALIGFFDEARHWYKARHGTSMPQIPRSVTELGLEMESGTLVIIEDTQKDKRFALDELTNGELHVRAYVGLPLVSFDGFVIGILSIIDHQPRVIDDEVLKTLQVIAHQVMAQLELRRTAAELELKNEELRASQALTYLSEQRFELIATVTTDAIWDWDIATNSIWVSNSFYEWLGLDQTSVQPSFELWTERAHSDDRIKLRAHWDAVLASPDKLNTNSYRLLKGNGTYAIVSDRSVVIRNAEGKAARVIGALTDLTERKMAQEILEAQAAMLDHASDGIMVRDLNHNTVFWNKSAERIYGWRSEELKGLNFCDFLCCDNQLVKVATEAVLSKGAWSGEMRHKTKNGREITVESRWSLLRNDQGEAKSILTINTDITEKKLIQTQFLRAQRLESIGTLAGGIAHDLNNVLAPITMAVEVLRMHITTPDARGTLDLVEKSARRGADMVKQVLGFARGVEGKRAVVHPKHLVKDVEKIIKETFPRNIQLKVSISPDTWPLQADVTQLHQVMLNLCVNARDAMPAGGTLQLSCENITLDEHYCSMQPGAHPGPYAVIRVIDSGTGMPDEVRERIFEPFFTTKKHGEGTGLGLATVMAVVKSHGGFITVYSEQTRGTTFKVYLPAAPGERETHTEETAELPRGNGELILVVDDEDSIRTITRQTLEAFGYRAITASDGAEAVAIYSRRGPEIALVITDIMMPIMDGPNTILALMRMNPAVKVIAASGLAANGGVAKAVAAGVKHFLNKPYTADKLLQTVRDALQAVSPSSPT